MAAAGEEAGKVAESAVPAPVQKAIDDGIDKAVELALAKVEELLNGRLEAVSAALAEHKAEVLAALEELAETGVRKLEDGALDTLDPMVEWAHQKIDGLVTAIERAVGISIAPTLPPAPGEPAATHTVEVAGAEKAGEPG